MTTGDPLHMEPKHKDKEASEPMETNDVTHVDHPLAPLQNSPALPMDKQNGEGDNCMEDLDGEEDRYKPEATVRFTIDNFSEFIKGNDSRLSQSVYVRGLPWKIMAMPRDNPRDKKRCLGFFLQCNADSDSPSWSCSAHAWLRLIAQKEGCTTHERKISHMFYPKENDWGYSQFQSVEQLTNQESGWYMNDSIILEVMVNADAPHGVQWDSKKHTGFIGLKNQGATCYMNSLLQTLFFTNKLRKAVYQLPTEKDDPQKSVALAMQRVFFDLQFSDKPVGTKKLTRSFGWDTFESFLQHDVQELCRVLLDNLESKMKGTSVEGIIPKLFEGRMKSYIRCTNVEFESNREEPFYDIALNVKGKKDLYESFDDYIKVETLEGDNKYDAGDYGLQDAEKGITFIKLPPVLHLQLMRFQYDPYQDANVKINDKFEFPDRLDLSRYMDKKSMEQANTPAIFILHAVLVHSGDNHGGHYVVYINPKGTARWCKFDDDVVSRASKNEVLEASYGGDDPELPQRACTNAYMLVYIRDTALSDVLGNVEEKDIPQHLRERLEEEREQDAIRKKERTEAHLYLQVMVVGEESLVGHCGFDLMDPDQAELTARKFRIKKTATNRDLYNTIAESYKMTPGVDFRLWHFSPRHSAKIFRPTELQINDKDGKDSCVEEFMRDDKTFLFLELPQDVAKPHARLQPFRSEIDVLIFLKYYDPRQKTLVYKGHIIISMKDILQDFTSEMCRRASLPRNSSLRIYQERGPGGHPLKGVVEEIERFDADLAESLGQNDLEDGIILIYQLREDPLRIANLECPTPLEYFDEILNRIEVELIDKDEQCQAVTLRSSLLCSQSVLLEELGRELNYDPHKIQLFKPAYRDGPSSSPIPHDPDTPVKELLGIANTHQLNQTSPVGARNYLHYQKIPKWRLFFGKVPIRVDELAKKRQLKICWMDSKMKVEEFVVYPDRTGTIKSILVEVAKQVQLAEGGTGKLRMVNLGSTTGQRIFNVVPNDEPIDKLFNPKLGMDPRVRVEEIPVDQYNIDPKTEHLLPVAHFHKEPNATFGVPFLIKVRHGEKYSDVKSRIQKLLDISDKEFEKYKFALVTQMTKVRYVEDMENFAVNLTELNVAPTPNLSRMTLPWLGLEHINKNKSRGTHPLEKAIVIHN